MLFLRIPSLKPLISLVLFIPCLKLLISGFRPLFSLRSHYTELESEAPFAILAVTMLVNSGIPPLVAFEALSDLRDILPHCSFEILRIKRDSMLHTRHISEQLRFELPHAKGTWSRLLYAIVNIERTGRSPERLMLDLMNLVMQDLRTELSRRSEYFRTLLSIVIVLFGAFPMLSAVLFTILASIMIIPIVFVFVFLSIFIGIAYMVLIDTQVPRIIDYTAIYRKISLKYIPLSIIISVLFYSLVMYFNLTLPIMRATSLAVSLMIFALPAWIEFRREASIVDDIVEKLPILMRDLADEIYRGAPPLLALERISEVHSYDVWMDRLISLIIRRIRITGSIREALKGIQSLLPYPMRIALGLLTLSEEYGARAESYHLLADILNEYMISVREFRKGNQIYRWVSLFIVTLSLSLIYILFHIVVYKVAMISELIREVPSPLPISVIKPNEIPIAKDAIYSMVLVNSFILSLIIGKTLDWRIGSGFREAFIISVMMILIVLLESLL